MGREELMIRLYNRSKPYLGVLFLQLGYAFNGLLVKSALNQGLNPYTFSVYRNILAAVAFGPFAYCFERKVRPRMTISVFFKLMLLALLEPVLDQILYYTGMKYTTATFAVAMCNILPALTFIMALIFRLEKVNIKKLHSQGKIIGTLVTVGGAMVMSLVGGPQISFPWTKVHHTSLHPTITTASSTIPQDQHLKGALMITAGCFCWAGFYILQASTLKSYPAELSLTTLICTMGALQGSILTILIEKGKKGIWSIGWDTKLFATLYSGVVRSGASYYVSGLVMRVKGPVFVTAFNPLGLVFVAIMSSFTLSEQLDLGKVIGSVIIIIGLYLIIWGKSKDSSLSKSGEDDNNGVEIFDQEMGEKKINECTKTSSEHDKISREGVEEGEAAV